MTYGGKVFATMVLTVALGAALTGCSAKAVWRSSRQMCVAHGGTYSHETQRCSFAAATTVSGQQACQDQAGIYKAEWQRCEFDE